MFHRITKLLFFSYYFNVTTETSSFTLVHTKPCLQYNHSLLGRSLGWEGVFFFLPFVGLSVRPQAKLHGNARYTPAQTSLLSPPDELAQCYRVQRVILLLFLLMSRSLKSRWQKSFYYCEIVSDFVLSASIFLYLLFMVM